MAFEVELMDEIDDSVSDFSGLFIVLVSVTWTRICSVGDVVVVVVVSGFILLSFFCSGLSIPEEAAIAEEEDSSLNIYIYIFVIVIIEFLNDYLIMIFYTIIPVEIFLNFILIEIIIGCFVSFLN